MSPSFLEELAQARPDPGGGAAAAYGARLGLALLEKVVKLELKRPPPASNPPPLWEQNLGQVRQLTAALTRLQDEDVQAYFCLAEARASPQPGRQLPAAVQEALEVPRQIMAKTREALNLVSWAGAHCKRHLISDLLVAVELLAAAFQGAYHIACANLPLITETLRREALASELSHTSQQGQESFLRVKRILTARGPHLDPGS
ncbi:MAG: cyclodeaminase/cyclohydrolase family protein [Desulfobaccales bacterium]|nr:cyclodeaminase/cyclohydrolase family protein [Desulfobaccales bacterium]